jgi:hypothetical protein
MNHIEVLISGYTAYTSTDEFAAAVTADAPEASPVLSFISVSTVACGGAVGSIIGGSVAGTVNWGC